MMKVSQEALIELISRAIQGEIRSQGYLYEFEKGEEDLTRLMMTTGGSVDLPLVSKAVLDAIGQSIRDKEKEELVNWLRSKEIRLLATAAESRKEGKLAEWAGATSSAVTCRLNANDIESGEYRRLAQIGE
ncbi:hypothetical protein [Sphingobium fluviale]|uniref:Uncharacterized protein n=1 Tax=Sphingobium fluviale TaxID=2506423 RepID=A0A4Q1KH07_9SPHN|nr:hypothetical protein [Sphingobium fluviale]RXR28991.1 hypothetical protein EQG66_07890 [Sphingobium fluviale]